MNRRLWTKEEEAVLIEMYPNPDFDTEDMVERLGRTKKQIYACANKLGLKAPKERMTRMGKKFADSDAARAHRFKKGNISHNKGKKTPPEIYAKMAATMFKKGQMPHNYKPIGTEVITEDGYIKVKVADPKKWKYKHRLIWEQHHGEIPPKHNIQFKDGNSLNCDINNLYIISMAEQMRTENSYIARYPKELQDVIRLKGAVKRRLTNIKKKNNEKE